MDLAKSGKDGLSIGEQLDSMAPEGADGKAIARPAGVRSPTIVSMQLAGWLVFACLWLPVARGCSGTIERPVDDLSWSGSLDIQELLVGTLIFGSYANGLIASGILIVATLLRNRRFLWRITQAQFVIALSIGVSLLITTLISDRALRPKTEGLLTIAPPILGAFVWIILARRQNDRELAWARLQHVWTLVALVMLHLKCLFATQLLVGYWLMLAGLLGLVVAVQVARHRMVHDLFDASVAARRPRFALWQVFVWTTMFALVFGYYSSLDKLLDIMFESDS